MPKASSSSTSALKRNQACKQCRKRKLKCDAQRPHCGTCVRTWLSQCAVPPPVGFACVALSSLIISQLNSPINRHPTEPTCTYDPVEGLKLLPEVAEDASERIRLLENQISDLKYKLQEAQSQQPQRRVQQQAQHQIYFPHGDASSSQPVASLSPPERPPSSSLYHSPSPPQTHSSIVLPQASLSISPDSRGQSRENIANDLTGYDAQQSSIQHTMEPDPFMDLLFLGWNPDLPEPVILTRLVDIFFRCDPCGSRILHRPSLMTSLTLPPTHADFPHPALLHAICASASRWTSPDSHIGPDGKRRDRFAEFHAQKTRAYIDQTMKTGAQIFQVLQACIILSWYLYAEGRWVEVWFFAGFQTRVAVPLRLNHPGTHSKQTGTAPAGYLPAPSNVRELEHRRRAWWMSLVFDRVVSSGGWLHGVDERDIGTELPLRSVDFEAEHPVDSNPQDLSTESTLIVHPPQYTDPFLLLIKACMLFSKVTDYNVRLNLRPSTATKGEDVRLSPNFRALDRLVAVEFSSSLPHAYKNCLGVGETPDGTNIDTDLYLVHLIPHAATITLHIPFINFSTEEDTSVSRCLNAAREILTAYYLITSTSFSITRLHPFVVTCWYLAAVVQVHLCKRLIEIGDRTSEADVWGEINLLRLALLEYGSQSPIGLRQEKLLQGFMAEILQLTSQAQPLKVGVPLYPFSHAGVFPSAQEEGGKSPDDSAGGHVAPLPSTAYEDEDVAMNSGSPGVSGMWNNNNTMAARTASPSYHGY
ncbi:hypothetical protein BU17DRAFT_81209 [Hysterangium stoloniferum]|nr:hypothetical protein BU17DRAFT_81209 [Hysterangium stoloniferum]